jgi:EAL and modified HD-GYP domain-containing signal transduction protein
MVALDDFVFLPGYEEIVRLADIIKIDFLQYSNRNDLEKLLYKIRKIGDKVLLAEKVETEEDFEIAKELGFSLFQGFFFSRPKLHSGLHLSPMELSRLQLLRCLRDEDLDFREIAEIIKRDAVLSHKLLRIVNSSHYGLSFFVNSILHALTILGTSGTRKWISFAILQDCAGENEQELSRMALTRGLFMERMVIPLKRKREKESFFLFGLFSMAEVLMRAPMAEVLSQTNLSSKVTQPLLTGEGDLAELLRLVICYERADWEKADEIAKKFNLNGDLLSKYYLEAMEEAIDLL